MTIIILCTMIIISLTSSIQSMDILPSPKHAERLLSDVHFIRFLETEDISISLITNLNEKPAAQASIDTQKSNSELIESAELYYTTVYTNTSTTVEFTLLKGIRKMQFSFPKQTLPPCALVRGEPRWRTADNHDPDLCIAAGYADGTVITADLNSSNLEIITWGTKEKKPIVLLIPGPLCNSWISSNGSIVHVHMNHKSVGIAKSTKKIVAMGTNGCTITLKTEDDAYYSIMPYTET